MKAWERGVCVSSTAEEEPEEALASAICLLFTLPTARGAGRGAIDKAGDTEHGLSQVVGTGRPHL